MRAIQGETVVVETSGKRRGNVTTELGSGHEVIAAIKKERPDLVLLDVKVADVVILNPGWRGAFLTSQAKGG